MMSSPATCSLLRRGCSAGAQHQRAVSSSLGGLASRRRRDREHENTTAPRSYPRPARHELGRSGSLACTIPRVVGCVGATSSTSSRRGWSSSRPLPEPARPPVDYNLVREVERFAHQKPLKPVTIRELVDSLQESETLHSTTTSSVVPGAGGGVTSSSGVGGSSSGFLQHGKSRSSPIDEASDPHEYLIEHANRCRDEIKTRMANRLFEIHRYVVPERKHVISNSGNTELVEDITRFSFGKFCLPDVCSEEGETEFTELLIALLDTHSVVLSHIRSALRALPKPRPELAAFFIRLFASRVGMRVLAEHHIALKRTLALREGDLAADYVTDFDEDGVASNSGGASGREYAMRRLRSREKLLEVRPGSVQANVRPVQLVLEVVREMKISLLNEDPAMVLPEVQITGDISAAFTYIPDHVSFIARQVIENAARATVAYHGMRSAPVVKQNVNPLPPVVVDVRMGEFDMCIKVTDRGGGMDMSRLPRIMALSERSTHNGRDGVPNVCLGLPCSQLYARYFGGDLHLQSMPGHGTNVGGDLVYINLNHLGTYQELNLNSVLRDVGTTSVSPGSGGYSSGPGLGTGFNPAVNWGNGSFSSGGYLYGAQTSQFSSYHSTSSGGGGQHHDSTYDGGGWAWGGAGRRF